MAAFHKAVIDRISVDIQASSKIGVEFTEIIDEFYYVSFMPFPQDSFYMLSVSNLSTGGDAVFCHHSVEGLIDAWVRYAKIIK